MSIVDVRSKDMVRYVELNYPDKKNGFDLRMSQELLDAVHQVNADPHCKIIVFSSTARAYFSSGPNPSDLVEIANQKNGLNLLDEIVSNLNEIISEIYHSTKITIASIHGYAYGGGLNIMLPCDYRIAVERTKLIENFHYMGMTPDLSASYFLPRLIGYSKTMELILTGRMFSAKEAWEWGLFQEVTKTKKEMKERVEQLCEQILSGDMETVARMKQLLKHSNLSTFNEQINFEKTALMDCFQNPRVQEYLSQVTKKSLVT
ncbi:enoyl-CoA hydratase/isomerase family protein [Lentibacillus cibarius]|uniref:Enoyl-CoA hydratase/isomerase family protein n=1 Tax=Lentibacillus cibarius TaxID=2583219 RepID=A0A5S3QKB8_9BACI|nr:enoyl-CoA hydratase/isomerase family protein [Lentibacillus cibarius]TMN20876.1 enoyl-CoA hydratase/isomerase family protein [Lentibacillus cibarius]